MPSPRSHLVAAVLVLLAAPPTFAVAQGQPWLHAPIEFTNLVGEFELLGDLDLDGDVDAITFHSPTQNAIKTTFTAWLNDGSGGLTPGATTSLPGGAGTRTRLADLDGDGDLDVVVATIGTSPLGSGLLVFPGQPGATFAPFLHVPLPGNVIAIEGGNGNGDAITDFVLTHALGNPFVGRWLFGAPGFALTLGPTEELPTVLEFALADANGDGLDDIAVPHDIPVGPGAMSFYLTTPLGFQLGQTLPLPGSISYDFASLDHDGDGDRDIVVRSHSTTNAVELTVLGNTGSGWTTQTQVFTNASTGRVFTGDWNGDGRDDVLMRSSDAGGNSHYVALFESDAANVFAPGYALRTGGAILDFGAGFADLNQDGHLDFLDSHSVWFGDGSFTPPFGTNSTSALRDWDGDGDQDVLPSNLSLHDGNGGLTPVTFTFPALPPNHVYDSARLITDLEEDGRHEIFVGVFEIVFFQYVFRGTHLLRETADHEFVFAGLAAPAPSRLTSGVVDDTDGDGDQDIVNQQGAWLNDGTNFFTLLGPITTGYSPIAKGDVDGDGDQDLLATTIGAGTSLAVLHRTAPNTWTTTVLFPAIGSTVTFVAPTRFFDVDDDGDLDVVGRERQSNGIWRALVFTNQSGVFTQAAILPHPGVVMVGDVDGDGLTDLAFYEAFRTVVLRRTGPGLVYAPPVAFLTGSCNDLVDFDQDGDLDATGQGVVQGKRFFGAAAGHRRQYGTGSLGDGGWRPLLGVRGPCRPGTTPTLSLRAAPGGTAALLVLGSGPNDAPSLILPGVQSYVAPIDLLLGFTLAGAPGVPGAGSIDLPVALPPGLGGVSVFLEFVVLDLSVPFAFTNSNGCELAVGL